MSFGDEKVIKVSPGRFRKMHEQVTTNFFSYISDTGSPLMTFTVTRMDQDHHLEMFLTFEDMSRLRVIEMKADSGVWQFLIGDLRKQRQFVDDQQRIGGWLREAQARWEEQEEA